MAAIGSQLNWVSEMIETVLWSAIWSGILGAWLVLAAAKVWAHWITPPQDPGKRRADTHSAMWHIAVPLFVIALAVPVSASAQGWWWGSPVNPGFDLSTVIRVNGTAAQVSLEARSGPATLTLECPRNTYTVVLAPSWYLRQIGAEIREGDPLGVEGSKMMDRRGNLHLVAARVTNERTGTVLDLRDEAGRPRWMGGHPWGSGR